MDLIEINGYTPPSPTKYEVSFSDVIGAEEQLENGYEYIEQIRTQVPSVSLAWTNLIESDAMAIVAAVEGANISCKYLFGTVKEDVFNCDSPKLTLKLQKNDKRYYDLSLVLSGGK